MFSFSLFSSWFSPERRTFLHFHCRNYSFSSGSDKWPPTYKKLTLFFLQTPIVAQRACQEANTFKGLQNVGEKQCESLRAPLSYLCPYDGLQILAARVNMDQGSRIGWSLKNDLDLSKASKDDRRVQGGVEKWSTKMQKEYQAIATPRPQQNPRTNRNLCLDCST